MLSTSTSRLVASVFTLTALFFVACDARGIEPNQEPEPEATEQSTVVEAIRAEALKPSRSDQGRPLPLAAHWHSRHFPLTKQLDLIEEGHYILPFISWPNPNSEENPGVEVPDGFERLADKGLPFSLIYGLQWTLPFWRTWAGPEYDAPDKAMKDGKLNPDVDPNVWYELGKAWTQAPSIKQMQEKYPDPPLVHLYSNNERKEKDGADYSDQEEALFEGLREGLVTQVWKDNSKILGYQGIWSPWDGGSLSYYQRDWKPWRRIHTYRSAQTRTMNHVPIWDGLRKQNKWLELIFWNGYPEKQEQYKEDGQEPTTPTKYRGWIQYGMWLMTPRVARQWNESTTPRLGENGFWPTFKEVIHAVDMVHSSETLKRFWRKGDLVPNTKYENRFAPGWLSENMKNMNRFFLLETNKHPDKSFGELYYKRSLKIFALARQIDDEYLIYAHAPLGNRDNVEIEIPNYGSVSVGTVKEGGSFFHVDSSGLVETIN